MSFIPSNQAGTFLIIQEQSPYTLNSDLPTHTLNYFPHATGANRQALRT